MTPPGTHFIRSPREFHQWSLGADEFDALVNDGIEVIVILTPTGRFTSTVDDWLDSGYDDLDGDVDVKVLHKGHMVKA